MKNFKILSVILIALTGMSIEQSSPTTTCGKATPSNVTDCTYDTSNASNDCCLYSQSGMASACVSISKTADLKAFSNSTYMGWGTINCASRTYTPSTSSTCGYANPTIPSQCFSNLLNSTLSCCHVSSPDLKTSYCYTFPKDLGSNKESIALMSALGLNVNCSSTWIPVSFILLIISAFLY